MADLVNLRQFKKRRKREDSEKQAVQHCRDYGKTKVEKLFDLRQKEKQAKFLDNNALVSKDEK